MSNNFTTSRSVKALDRVIIGSDYDRSHVPGLCDVVGDAVLVVTTRVDRTGSSPVQLTVAYEATGEVIGTFGYRWFAPAPVVVRPTFIANVADRSAFVRASRFGKLDPAYKRVLKQAGAGNGVDLAALRSALFAAMRCATTANGQSMGRRADAELIERCWNRLPGGLDFTSGPVVSDERAKQIITEAKAEVDRLTAKVIQGTNDLAEATLANEGLRAHADRLHESRQQHGADRDRAIYAASAAVERADNLRKALEYAKASLSVEQAAKVEGFLDGLAASI